jgi:hypothetical protein
MLRNFVRYSPVGRFGFSFFVRVGAPGFSFSFRARGFFTAAAALFI